MGGKGNFAAAAGGSSCKAMVAAAASGSVKLKEAAAPGALKPEVVSVSAAAAAAAGALKLKQEAAARQEIKVKAAKAGDALKTITNFKAAKAGDALKYTHPKLKAKAAASPGTLKTKSEGEGDAEAVKSEGEEEEDDPEYDPEEDPDNDESDPDNDESDPDDDESDPADDESDPDDDESDDEDPEPDPEPIEEDDGGVDVVNTITQLHALVARGPIARSIRVERVPSTHHAAVLYDALVQVKMPPGMRIYNLERLRHLKLGVGRVDSGMLAVTIPRLRERPNSGATKERLRSEARSLEGTARAVRGDFRARGEEVAAQIIAFANRVNEPKDSPDLNELRMTINRLLNDPVNFMEQPPAQAQAQPQAAA